MGRLRSTGFNGPDEPAGTGCRIRHGEGIRDGGAGIGTPQGEAAFLALIAVLPLVAMACTPDFTPQSFIDKPRVLGIVATPPEVQFSADEQGSVLLTAVIALPGPDKEGQTQDVVLKDLEWSACILNLGAQAQYRCAVQELPLDGDFGTGTATLDGALLAAGLELLRPFVGEFLEAFKQVIEKEDDCLRTVLADWDACMDRNGGEGEPCMDAAYEGAKACLFNEGLEVMIHLAATVGPPADDTANRVMHAYKRVAFRQIDEARPANRIPGFRVRVDGRLVADTAGAGGGEPFEALWACPGRTITFEPELHDDAVEKVAGEDGQPVAEAIFMSWFATSGDFDRIKSSTAVPKPGDPVDLSNELEMWKDDEMPQQTRVWVFCRDDRLGMSYVTFPVLRQDPDRCATLVDAWESDVDAWRWGGMDGGEGDPGTGEDNGQGGEDPGDSGDLPSGPDGNDGTGGAS
jgi:hypothetical protein